MKLGDMSVRHQLVGSLHFPWFIGSMWQHLLPVNCHEAEQKQTLNKNFFLSIKKCTLAETHWIRATKKQFSSILGIKKISTTTPQPQDGEKTFFWHALSWKTLKWDIIFSNCHWSAYLFSEVTLNTMAVHNEVRTWRSLLFLK